MMLQLNPDDRRRLQSAIGVALLHAALGYALLTGLGVRFETVSEGLKTFNVFEQPPPPVSEPPPPEKVATSDIAKPKDPEGAASPANLKDTPTEIVAPKPEIRLPIPPPVVAAPIAGQGNAAAAGAAPIPGPGTGRGGFGTGLGSGVSGDGTGGGGGGLGRPTRARQIAGGIDEADYPASAYRARIGGTVSLRFVVAPTGRVSRCSVTRSSGNAALDETTCRLILRRFRYRPARDNEGNPTAETITGQHVWEVGPEPPPIDVEPEIEDY
jgi:protein TonB